VVIAGTFEGNIDLGGGPIAAAGSMNFFVAAFDAQGKPLWSKGFGGPQGGGLNGLAVDAAGNVVIAGAYYGTIDLGGGPLSSAGDSDIFVAKLDSAGKLLWSKSFGDTSADAGYGVAVDASGAIFVGGGFQGTVNFGGAPLTSSTRQAFLAKLDGAGAHVWSQHLGGGSGGLGQIERVALDPKGNLAVAGPLQGSFALGSIPLSGTGAGAGFVGKLTATGEAIWAHAIASGGSYPPMNALAVDSQGAVVLGGSFVKQIDLGAGPIASKGGTQFGDAFLAKWDDAGAPLFSKTYGDVGEEILMGIAVGADDHLYVSGSVKSTLTFGKEPLVAKHAGENTAFLARLDAAGNEVWSRGLERDLRGMACALRPSGNILLAGIGWVSAQIGDTVIDVAGGSDAFLFELAQTP
jgi:hypothetical protein